MVEFTITKDPNRLPFFSLFVSKLLDRECSPALRVRSDKLKVRVNEKQLSCYWSQDSVVAELPTPLVSYSQFSSQCSIETCQRLQRHLDRWIRRRGHSLG